MKTKGVPAMPWQCYHAAGIGFGLEVDFPRQTDVRFGPLADICAEKSHVRFTPECGHRKRFLGCLLRAKIGKWNDNCCPNRIECHRIGCHGQNH
jgi:hypothetical protein